MIIKTVFKLFSYNYQSHMCSTLKTYVNSKHAVKKREDAILTRPVFASILTEKCPNGNIREQRTKQRTKPEASLEPTGHHTGGQAQGLNRHQCPQESFPANEPTQLWFVCRTLHCRLFTYATYPSKAIFCLLPQHSFC